MLSRLGLLALSVGILLSLAALSGLTHQAAGQDPAPPPHSADGNTGGQAASDRNYYPEHVQPQAYYEHRRRSIVHHYPYPYPSYYNEDASAGFRNPGNIGRHAEYYYPGETFQNQGDPVKVAQFGVGGYPSRSEQLAAQQVGIQRYNSIQQHIDRMAMPRFGYGFGVGGFGGFW